VAGGGPRREQQQHARAILAAHRVPLARVEPHERSRSTTRGAAAAFDVDLSVDNGQPDVLLHLVLAELLARLKHDQHGASPVVRVEDDRVARPVRRGRRVKIPALHGRSVYAYTQPLFMPLVVDSFVMGPFQSNCYVVRSARGAAEAVVIDPGDDPTPLRLELAGMGAHAAAILVTHTDVDHIGGVAALAEGVGVEVWAPSGEADALKNGETRGGMRVAPHDPEHLVSGGDEVAVAGLTFDVVDVPGHSAGHVAFYADGHLFSGDLLFAGSVGRVDLAGGDWDTLLASVRALLDRFPADTVVHSGHGPATTLGRELQTNPFLRELRGEST
jgi:hydroxyacylglutathione hydrolase